jgi:hypothetical protein
MAIPESQLDTWSRQGSVSASSDTYASIQHALDRYAFPSHATFEVYLQGSYRNNTNIRGDSDVDIVVELTSAFRGDTASLTVLERQRYSQLTNAAYDWNAFRADVLLALRRHYGLRNVIEGKKALKVPKGGPPINSDVIVAMRHKKFSSLLSASLYSALEGITFFVPSGHRWIVNYPTLHYYNGVAKNGASRTNGWFKASVRIFKNAKGYMVDHGLIQGSLAPSHFIECLLYNVPDSCFGYSYQNTYYNTCTWLQRADIGSLLYQHGQGLLCTEGFGFGSDQWPVHNAQHFIQQLAYLWDNWPA